MYFRFLLIGLLLSFFPLLLSAQIANDDELTYRTFRATLLPGIGTTGFNSANVASKYSINILGGYHGGLDGYEIGLININLNYTRGIQIGGFNASGGEMTGVNIAALANFSRQEMAGIQLALFANAAERSVLGIQAAGFVNSSYQNLRGIQLAGISNISRRNMQGLQLAGVFNSSIQDAQGIMISGFGNFNAGTAQGIFVAGAANFSRDQQGITFAGVVNMTRRMQGVQISGLANLAYRVRGIQIGFINYAHDFDGIPIGLISYYGNGRKNIDVWMSDGGFQNIGLKLGTTSVYNMVSFGYNPFLTGREVWSLGWTIGSYKPLEEAWEDSRFEGFFRMRDFSIQNVQEGRVRTRLNSIYSFRYLIGIDLPGSHGFYAGPTFNMLLSREARSNEYTWYSIFHGERGGNDFSFWVGFTVGLQFFGH